MKLIAVADTHNYYKDLKIKDVPDDGIFLEDADIFIHAGDIEVRNLKEMYKFANWLEKLDYKYKIVVGGNHDFSLEKNYLFIKTYFEEKGIIYLENDEVVIDSIKFWGSPYTPEFNNWAFMKPRGDQMSRIWNKMPNDVDVLITHGPPLQIRDVSSMAGGGNFGCYDLDKRIEEVQPKIHIFGHIHECYGSEVHYWDNYCTTKDEFDPLKMTRYFNVSVLDGDYNLVNKPTVIYV